MDKFIEIATKAAIEGIKVAGCVVVGWVTVKGLEKLSSDSPKQIPETAKKEKA